MITNRTIRICCFFSWVVFSNLSLNAQVSFTAETRVTQVPQNDFFNLSFKLENGNGFNFKPPSFRDFVVIDGPNQMRSSKISNGQRSTVLVYNYTLQAKKRGRFQIGSAAIQVGNKVYRSNPVPIQVVLGKQDSKGKTAEPFFIEAVVNANEAYIGQQLIVDYKLYTNRDVEGYNVMEESEYPGFFAEDIKRFPGGSVQEIKNGAQYTTKILKRVALYPQQAGQLEITPLVLMVGIVMERKQVLLPTIKRIAIETDTILVNVQSVPLNAPDNCSGGVGRFNIETELQRSVITTDDVIAVKMTINGNGDIKRVQAPQIEFPESFEVYDPKIIDEANYEVQGEIVGRKVLEYLALPKEPGEYELSPGFCYFDPDSATYITAAPQTFSLTVRPGTGKTNAGNLPIQAEDLDYDIRPIKAEPKLFSRGNYFIGSILFWVLFALPIVAFVGIRFREYRAQKQGAIDPAIIKKQRAQKVAEKRMGQAQEHMQANQTRAFYDEVSKAMLDYVCDKLQIPRAELTKENVQTKLEELQAAPEDINAFMDLIKTTEMALFAGKDNAEAMQETYQKGVGILARIEAYVKGATS